MLTFSEVYQDIYKYGQKKISYAMSKYFHNEDIIFKQDLVSDMNESILVLIEKLRKETDDEDILKRRIMANLKWIIERKARKLLHEVQQLNRKFSKTEDGELAEWHDKKFSEAFSEMYISSPDLYVGLSCEKIVSILVNNLSKEELRFIFDKKKFFLKKRNKKKELRKIDTTDPFYTGKKSIETKDCDGCSTSNKENFFELLNRLILSDENRDFDVCLEKNFSYNDFNSMFPDDDSCYNYVMNAVRGNESCSSCGKDKFYYVKKRKKVICCSFCRKQFYPLASTSFFKSSTPLRKWFHAIFLVSIPSNNITILNISYELSVTYKTAFRMVKIINRPKVILRRFFPQKDRKIIESM